MEEKLKNRSGRKIEGVKRKRKGLEERGRQKVIYTYIYIHTKRGSRNKVK